ncbi:hypothetical protein [Algoriphagus sp.]|uniref:hypothetical protein n=1 Tax=Algoriphagus sp. TaxID=1872435 RepID=UPI003F6E86F7
MKTSNKIIVSFLIFSWGSIIATLLISHQFADRENRPGVRRVVTKSEALEPFSVVVLNQIEGLKVARGDGNQLLFNEYFGGDVVQPAPEVVKEYTILNDTLFIQNLPRASNGDFRLEVAGLQGLVVTDSKGLDLGAFHQDSLRVYTDGSEVLLSRESDFSFFYLGFPDESSLIFTDTKGLKMNLKDKVCELSGDIGRISGELTGDSELHISAKVGQLDVKTSDGGKVILK